MCVLVSLKKWRHFLNIYEKKIFTLIYIYFYFLGDKYKHIKVGAVATPIGTWQLSVSYRTDMTISPQPSGIDESILMKTDHFKPDFSPKRNRNQLRYFFILLLVSFINSYVYTFSISYNILNAFKKTKYNGMILLWTLY